MAKSTFSRVAEGDAHRVLTSNRQILRFMDGYIFHRSVLRSRESTICTFPYRDVPASDNASNADAKVVRQLRIRSGGWIDGLALDFTDGTSTPWHGGQGGNYHTFTLESGEDFTHIRVTANDTYITGLQFGTSKGAFRACA